MTTDDSDFFIILVYLERISLQPEERAVGVPRVAPHRRLGTDLSIKGSYSYGIQHTRRIRMGGGFAGEPSHTHPRRKGQSRCGCAKWRTPAWERVTLSDRETLIQYLARPFVGVFKSQL